MSRREFEPDLDFQKAFGNRIKDLREAVGWTQGDLYEHSRVSVYQIGRIENGHEGPKLQTVLAIALALGKKPTDLFEFKYHYKLNKTFPKVGKHKPGTTKILNRLLQDDFFGKPRAVSDVLKVISEKFNKQIKSADVSGSLLMLVEKRKLSIVSKGSKNLYQNC